MKRAELEHIIRAAADISDDEEIIVIGSQAILGAHPDAPPELLVSVEADVFPKHHPERADIIDGAIGELSLFHDTFGYYAQGVGEGTAILPADWKTRLVAVRGPGTRGATGWCLEPHDLAVSKLIAGRDKDIEFVAAALRHSILDPTRLRERLDSTNLEAARRSVALTRLDTALGLR